MMSKRHYFVDTFTQRALTNDFVVLYDNIVNFKRQHKISTKFETENNVLLSHESYELLCTGFFRKHNINPKDISTIVLQYLDSNNNKLSFRVRSSHFYRMVLFPYRTQVTIEFSDMKIQKCTSTISNWQAPYHGYGFEFGVIGLV